jgi:hypothetical protein
MVAVDSASPAVALISNGRRHVCSLGPRTEDPGSWKCSWCGHANVRQHAGLDHCSACNKYVFRGVNSLPGSGIATTDAEFEFQNFSLEIWQAKGVSKSYDEFDFTVGYSGDCGRR